MLYTKAASPTELTLSSEESSALYSILLMEPFSVLTNFVWWLAVRMCCTEWPPGGIEQGGEEGEGRREKVRTCPPLYTYNVQRLLHVRPGYKIMYLTCSYSMYVP